MHITASDASHSRSAVRGEKGREEAKEGTASTARRLAIIYFVNSGTVYLAKKKEKWLKKDKEWATEDDENINARNNDSAHALSDRAAENQRKTKESGKDVSGKIEEMR